MEAKICREPIAAIATPVGRGGIGIVRISGSGIQSFCSAILGCVPKPRVATYSRFLGSEGSVIDQGIALYFPSPGSFTGEEILELQAHGGRIILDLLLARALELGARMARPGEFSERAFLNQKIDLLQAEAIADLIEAGTVQAVRSARRAMEGAFSIHVNELLAKLTELQVYVEAAIDFSEEEIDFLSDGTLFEKLTTLERSMDLVLSIAKQGQILRDGIHLVIAGKPNSGKSSLLNALTRKETAIVHSQPGTTRDVLRESIVVDGIPVHLVDTAGLRSSEDPVEKEGIRRAHLEIDQADQILWMIDASASEASEPEDFILSSGRNVTRIFNKIDLSGATPALINSNRGTEIYLSVKSGAGMDFLTQHLKDCMGYNDQIEDVFIARRRHLVALNDARRSIANALIQILKYRRLELIAEDLRQARQSLSEITGAFTTDDLLGKIFSSFCIGK